MIIYYFYSIANPPPLSSLDYKCKQCIDPLLDIWGSENTREIINNGSWANRREIDPTLTQILKVLGFFIGLSQLYGVQFSHFYIVGF